MQGSQLPCGVRVQVGLRGLLGLELGGFRHLVHWCCILLKGLGGVLAPDAECAIAPRERPPNLKPYIYCFGQGRATRLDNIIAEAEPTVGSSGHYV